jgi:hypothetical protein
LACSSDAKDSQAPAGGAGGQSGGASGAGVGQAGSVSGAGPSAGGNVSQSGTSGAAGSMPVAGSTSEAGMAGGGGMAGAGGSADEVPCSSETPQGCRRGLYLSPYTDHSGQITFEGDTAQHLHILDDDAKQEQVLDFIAAQHIDSLSLYDLATVLGDAELEPKLVAFVAAARERGVVEVNAIGDTYETSWDAIAATQAQHPLFDGLVTEIEFWNASATFEEFAGIAQYVRALDLKTPSGAPMPLGAYIGWPTPEQVTALTPLVDRLFVHVYVKDAAAAYDYGKERFAAIAAATSVEVRPIFSAEGQDWSAGDEHFMGDYFATHALAEAEATFLTAWEAEAAPLPNLGGFQYYDYFYLERYLP